MRRVRRSPPGRGRRAPQHSPAQAAGRRPSPDGEQAADQRAHHVVAEGVGAHRRHGQRRPSSRVPGQVEQRRGPSSAPSRCLQNAAKSCSPEQRARPRRSSRRGRAAAARPARAPRVSGSTGHGVVGDPVGVAPPQRGEPGVEPGRGLGHPAYPHVGGQHAVEPAQQRLRRRVPRTGRPRPPGRLGRRRGAPPGRGRAPRCRCGRRRSPPPPATPQHRGQRRLELALHGAQPRLGRPAVEVGAVVGEVDPDPHGAHPASRGARARGACSAGDRDPQRHPGDQLPVPRGHRHREDPAGVPARHVVAGGLARPACSHASSGSRTVVSVIRFHLPVAAVSVDPDPRRAPDLRRRRGDSVPGSRVVLLGVTT